MLAEELKKINRHLLLMFDYDGTLTPIVDYPEKAQITDEQLGFLNRLIACDRFQVAIVSGRSIEQLKHFLHTLEGFPVYLSGIHGGEMIDYVTGENLVEPDISDIAKINEVYEKTKYLEEKYCGIQMENKTHTLVLHYRRAQCEADEEEALNEFRQVVIASGYLNGFKFKPGKKILELMPQSYHKGMAVEKLYALMQEKNNASYYPVYFGDDITDEDAFETVNRLGGASVFVGSYQNDTCAGHHLQDVPQLYQLINTLACEAD